MRQSDTSIQLNMDDFVNSIRDSTYIQDDKAAYNLPDEEESQLIETQVGLKPAEIQRRAHLSPYLLAVKNLRDLKRHYTPIDKLRVVASSSSLIT